MTRLIVIFALFSCVLRAGAAWYWPFGSNEEEELTPLSELMKPLNRFMDDAADYAADRDYAKALTEYRKALHECSRLELEHPEWAEKKAFATVRSKYAIIEAAINSLLLAQAQANAKAVAVTDTTKLEQRFAEERAAEKAAKANRGKTASDRNQASEPEKEPEAESAAEAEAKPSEAEPPSAPEPQVEVRQPEPPQAKSEPPQAESEEWQKILQTDPKNRRARMMQARSDFMKKDYASALLMVKELLQEKPNDAAALNLRAMIERATGDLKAAEATLEQLITSNPKSYYGFYNLAKLILQTRGEAGKDQARRYYETGRVYCKGPVDKVLEEALK